MGYPYQPAPVPAARPARRPRPWGIVALCGGVLAFITLYITAAKLTMGGETALTAKGSGLNSGILVGLLGIAVIILGIIWLARRKEGKGLPIAVLVLGVVALLGSLATFGFTGSADDFVDNVSISAVKSSARRAGTPIPANVSDDEIRTELKAALRGAETSIGPGAILALVGSLAMAVGGLMGIITQRGTPRAAAPAYPAPPPGIYQQPAGYPGAPPYGAPPGYPTAPPPPPGPPQYPPTQYPPTQYPQP